MSRESRIEHSIVQKHQMTQKKAHPMLSNAALGCRVDSS
jgi:hypothetical protein